MFKAGDKIRRTRDVNNHWWEAHCLRVGKAVTDVFTVSAMRGSSGVYVEDANMAFTAENFEKVEKEMVSKYKVGDRLYIKGISSSKFARQVGVVTKARYSAGIWRYILEGSLKEDNKLFRTEITESNLVKAHPEPVDKNYHVYSETGAHIYKEVSLEEAKELAANLSKKNPTITYYVYYRKCVAKVTATIEVTPKIVMV